MPTIQLSTEIKAPISVCFDLARSIDLHKLSTEGSDEEAIAGVTQGLIGFGEEVTWRATHFGVRQTLSSRITVFHRPFHFRDEMVKGIFKMIRHDHLFEWKNDRTTMIDKFEFQSPGWIIGSLVNKLFLTKYLTQLLQKRNLLIKQIAEEGAWHAYVLKPAEGLGVSSN